MYQFTFRKAILEKGMINFYREKASVASDKLIFIS